VNRGQLEARTVELPDGRKYKRVFVPTVDPDPGPPPDTAGLFRAPDA
jgi:hypothetical protein